MSKHKTRSAKTKSKTVREAWWGFFDKDGRCIVVKPYLMDADLRRLTPSHTARQVIVEYQEKGERK